MTDDPIQQIVADLYLVASHVASWPRDEYAGFEVKRAELLLRTVDLDALSDTLQSVLFVSDTYGTHTHKERQVAAAARRLDLVQDQIRNRRSAIQRHMAA